MTIIIWLLVVAFTVCSLFLIFVILIQSGKGGGLGGAFGGASSALSDTLGASSAEKTLTRWTVYASIMFAILCLVITLLASKAKKPSLFEDLQTTPPAATAPQQPGIQPAPSDEIPPQQAPENANAVVPEAEVPSEAVPAEIPAASENAETE